MNNTVYFQHLLPRQSADLILVAEDHEDIRTFICKSLVPYFRVVAVANGDQAWQLGFHLMIFCGNSGYNGPRYCWKRRWTMWQR